MVRLPDPAALRPFAQAHDLRLVVLFGSRARGAHRDDSDLDLGLWLGRAPSAEERSAIVRGLVGLCGTDRLDLAFLDTASPLLVWEAARTGRPLFEASRGVFTDFCVRAFHRRDDARRFLALVRTFLERFLAEADGRSHARPARAGDPRR